MWETILGPQAQAQFLEAMITMVKTGGAYSLIGIWIYYFAPVVKVLGVSWLIYKVAMTSLTHVSNLYLLRKLNKNTQVSLLSKQTSKHLEDLIKDWRQEQKKLNDELMLQVKDLKENSKETKTTKPV